AALALTVGVLTLAFHEAVVPRLQTLQCRCRCDHPSALSCCERACPARGRSSAAALSRVRRRHSSLERSLERGNERTSEYPCCERGEPSLRAFARCCARMLSASARGSSRS